MNADEKLKLLADASQYDLSCACGTRDGEDHRRRGPGGVWLYPTSLPRGGQSVMLKTLLSNACVNDCRYCPFRAERDVRRCTLAPEEVAALFLDYARQRKVHGLFLTSGVIGTPDHTMEQMVAVAELLRRRHQYRGFLHLKIIPGSSDAAIEAALGMATAVSLNVEAPRRAAFASLSTRKDYDRDIVRPIHMISRLTAPGNRFHGVKQTTQFIVGAADETDSDIIQATYGLYKRLHLSRVYYSAYQRGLGDPSLPGERREGPPEDLLTREHRLYQVDWLIRKYGFAADEVPLGADGNLPLAADPKESWAQLHPERFPVNLNRAPREELLRVPGLGPLTVRRILLLRRDGGRLSSLDALGRVGKRLGRAAGYVTF